MRVQLELALESGLPVVLHIRDAYEPALSILDEFQTRWDGVIHCYSSDAAMAAEFLDRGFHLSFTGVLTYPRATVLRDAARMVPMERLLVETDAPFLAPDPFRGKRNQPSYVAFVVQELATVHGVTPETMAQVTRRNTIRVFGLEDPGWIQPESPEGP